MEGAIDIRHRWHVRASSRGAPVVVTGDSEARRKFEEFQREQRSGELQLRKPLLLRKPPLVVFRFSTRGGFLSNMILRQQKILRILCCCFPLKMVVFK